MVEIDPQLDEKLKKFLAGRPRQYKGADAKQLQVQVNGLADTLVDVVRERDVYLSAAVAAESAKLWVRILTVTVIVEAAIIGVVFNQLFARLK